MAVRDADGATPQRRLRVNASFTACAEAHDRNWCATAFATLGRRPGGGVKFHELANSKAVVELDGWGCIPSWYFEPRLLLDLLLMPSGPGPEQIRRRCLQS